MVYHRSEVVVDRKEDDGSYFLFETTSGKFRQLNHTAGMLWEMCDGRTTEQDMVQRIMSACPSVDQARVVQDVAAFLGELVAAGMVIRQEG